MRLSSLADYAVVMLTAASRHCGQARRLNATLVAQKTAIPLPTVQKLVSRLSAAGLIESTRGTGGGFRLARPPAAISLADIIEAVEGPIALTSCVDSGRHDCAIETCCSVKPHWNVVNNVVRDALAGISLASLTPSPFASSEVEKHSPDKRFSTKAVLGIGEADARGLETNGSLKLSVEHGHA